MDFNLYTHQDFDGLVTGACVITFAREVGLKLNAVHFVNYSTHPLKEWDSFAFPSDKVSIVTDYMFSQSLLNTPFFIWSDHHQREHSDHENKVDNGIIVFDDTAPSCAHLWKNVVASLNPNLASLIPWVDIVDSASYDSPEQAVLMQDLPLQIAVATSQIFDDPQFLVNLMEQIMVSPVEEIIKHPKIKDAYRRYTWKQKKSIDHLTENLEVIKGNSTSVGICSFAGLRFSSRYAAFLVNPDIDYLIFIRKVPPWNTPQVSVSLSLNPWKKSHKNFNLNEVLQRVIPGDSGGHENVAAAVLPNAIDAISAAHEVAKVLCGVEITDPNEIPF